MDKGFLVPITCFMLTSSIYDIYKTIHLQKYSFNKSEVLKFSRLINGFNLR